MFELLLFNVTPQRIKENIFKVGFAINEANLVLNTYYAYVVELKVLEIGKLKLLYSQFF